MSHWPSRISLQRDRNNAILRDNLEGGLDGKERGSITGHDERTHGFGADRKRRHSGADCKSRAPEEEPLGFYTLYQRHIRRIFTRRTYAVTTTGIVGMGEPTPNVCRLSLSSHGGPSRVRKIRPRIIMKFQYSSPLPKIVREKYTITTGFITWISVYLRGRHLSVGEKVVWSLNTGNGNRTNFKYIFRWTSLQLHLHTVICSPCLTYSRVSLSPWAHSPTAHSSYFTKGPIQKPTLTNHRPRGCHRIARMPANTGNNSWATSPGLPGS